MRGQSGSHRFEDPFFELFFALFLVARVFAAFFADADFAAFDRFAAALPPLRPPFFAGALFTGLPRPEPLFLPPPRRRVDCRPSSSFGFFLRNSALFVTFFDVFCLSLLLISVSAFVTSWHCSPSLDR